MSLLRLENVSYHYEKSNKEVLKDISYNFETGRIYAIVGKSGAGKTTLLSILSSLVAPTGGAIYLNEKDIAGIDKYHFRSSCVGVVFQSFNLLTHLTARENIELSMDISGKKYKNKKERALELLDKVGLDETAAESCNCQSTFL